MLRMPMAQKALLQRRRNDRKRMIRNSYLLIFYFYVHIYISIYIAIYPYSSTNDQRTCKVTIYLYIGIYTPIQDYIN